MGKNSVMFLVYNVSDVYMQCHFHLLRYLATRDPQQSKSIIYLIYTDRPTEFERWGNLGIELEIVDTPLERIRSWCGPQQFGFRAKIVALQDALQRFGGNILYCDADTYPRTKLDALFKRIGAGDLFMYEDEGYIDKKAYPHFHAYHDRFATHARLDVGSRAYNIPLTAHMWNAGVVGINSTQAPLLDEALAFCDALYRELPYFSVEQFSISHIFGASPGGCNAARDFMYHYWPVRRYVVLLKRLFSLYGEQDVDRLIRASDRILAEDLAPLKAAWDRSRPFQFLRRNYPYGRELVSRFDKRQWPIEEQFGRLEGVE